MTALLEYLYFIYASVNFYPAHNNPEPYFQPLYLKHRIYGEDYNGDDRHNWLLIGISIAK